MVFFLTTDIFPHFMAKAILGLIYLLAHYLKIVAIELQSRTITSLLHHMIIKSILYIFVNKFFPIFCRPNKMNPDFYKRWHFAFLPLWLKPYLNHFISNSTI